MNKLWTTYTVSWCRRVKLGAATLNAMAGSMENSIEWKYKLKDTYDATPFM